MKRLRSFYIDGVENIEANVELALSWTLKAAELDDCESQRMLGIDYLIGTHIDVDYNKASFWSKKAADKGDAQAQYALGVMYKRGFFEDGVDIVEAEHWFSLSASQGFQLAIDELELIKDV
jgi:hypothetical protein